jgi:hypothetical protein
MNQTETDFPWAAVYSGFYPARRGMSIPGRHIGPIVYGQRFPTFLLTGREKAGIEEITRIRKDDSLPKRKEFKKRRK